MIVRGRIVRNVQLTLLARILQQFQLRYTQAV